MTRKLLLIIALGTALAVVTAGSATSVTVDLPSGQVLTQCSDLADNDGDGAVDLGDPGCSGPLDGSEYNAPTSGGGGVGGVIDDTVDDVTGGGETGGGETDGGGTVDGGTDGGGGGTGGGGGGAGAQPGGGAFANQDGGGKGGKRERNKVGERKKIKEPPIRRPDGSPTRANPGLTIADFGPAPIGVPNFVIDQFEIPPFLLPLYQACGTEYGIPWQVLASINRIETAFGTNLNVSSAGAVGWMQFLPSTWQMYGVDANDDGREDPYNPPDAICAAARYLRAAGGAEDLRTAIFAYNHADWYVDEVLLYANQYAKLPDDLVGSLTGLTEGAHFPVAADARYADDISEREALKRSKTNRLLPGNAADVISDSPTRRGINIYSRVNAPVVAVNDGVIKKMGQNERLGKYIVLQDAYGNRYTYAQLGSLSEVHAVPKKKSLNDADFELVRGGDKDPRPSQPASAGTNDAGGSESERPSSGRKADPPVNTEELRQRLFALPERPANLGRAGVTGQLDALLARRLPAYETFKGYFSGVFRFDSETMQLRPLHVGSQVTGGTVLGRIGRTEGAPHVNFAIRPAGRGAPKIDPKPILDGWKLLETTAIYRAAGEDPFGSETSIGEILLMSKAQLQRRVLADPRLEIYSCGRSDIRSGVTDRRVLALLEYLTERGYRLTVTSLTCGHGYYTTSGNVSAHSYGAAVDIAQVNGIPILGNQGRGTITEAVIKDILLLQGAMRPDQVISLMDMGVPTFAMGDHADHIHVGYSFSISKGGRQFVALLKPEQWQRLIDRLGEIENPKVPAKPSEFATPSRKRASGAHRGE
jgi:hypothetical protein